MSIIKKESLVYSCYVAGQFSFFYNNNSIDLTTALTSSLIL